MKILWFVEKQFDTSLDKTTWLETTKFLQKRHEVYLVSGFKRIPAEYPELKNDIIYVRSPGLKFLTRFGHYFNQIRLLEKLVAKIRPTRILFNTNNFLLLRSAAQLKARYRFEPYLDIRTLPVSPKKIDNFVERQLFSYSLKTAARSFDGITYISEKIRTYCLEVLNLPAHPSAIWASGVDPEVFRPMPKGTDRETFVLLYHGNVASNRGLDTAIRALELIRDRDVRLVILGDGYGLAELKALALNLNLADKVIFRPPVPIHEVPGQIGQADAGILPFPDWVGWATSSPIKLFEYLACGKPVIVTKIAAHSDVLDKEPFAFWADTSTPGAIAHAIVEAMKARETIEIIGAKARKFAVKNCSWERQAGKLEDFLLRAEKRPA